MKAFATTEWGRAGRSLRAAQELLRIDADSAASRAYYAAFHALTALFALRGLAFTRHAALRAALNIPSQREVELPVKYKGQPLQCTYKADFICYRDLIIEAKALSRLTGVEEAKLINYLKATGYPVGLLINFGAKSLETRRLVLKKSV